MVLGLVLIFVIVLVILLGLSVGVAFLLHWLIPAVGMEMALLAAVIAVGQAMLILGRLVGALQPPVQETESEREPRPIVILDQEVVFPRRGRKRP